MSSSIACGRRGNKSTKIVLGGRLELPRVAPLVPKTSAYTNSAIPALCPRWESNPHPLRDTILSRARIPVPPLGPMPD